MKDKLYIIAVDFHYHKHLNTDILSRLSKRFDIILCTNNPGYRREFADYGVFWDAPYNKSVFSYFDKLLLPLKYSIENKTGVYYCDVNKLHEIDNLVAKDPYSFYYKDHWPIATYFMEMKDAEYWQPLIKYFNHIDYDYSNLKTIEEHAYYIPYHRNSNRLLHTLEWVKPVFEYISCINHTPYVGIGNGEGLALSYALDKCNIDKYIQSEV